MIYTSNMYFVIDVLDESPMRNASGSPFAVYFTKESSDLRTEILKASTVNIEHTSFDKKCLAMSASTREFGADDAIANIRLMFKIVSSASMVFFFSSITNRSSRVAIIALIVFVGFSTASTSI